MSTFEVVRGAEGDCLLLDDTRISGPKPWGGGTVTKTFHTDEAYVVVPKDELDRLKAENAELVRVLHELEQEAVHAYRCLQHDCEQVLESEQHFFKKWWSSDCENAKLRESVRRLMTQRDERLATAEHKSNELSEGVSRHLLCIACLAPTRNAADSIIVRCRDCKHYTDHSINLHPHWCRKHGSYRISPDFFCAWGERRDVDA